ncbi:MAG: hypothetical protein SYNGOMJ08_00576 [Candidatus Syntrophoarchaeum sp. GoM_oil]|nr:MAG: hypothetical protein SYNGOMJ08_00576 [Candidatus Syntrophoarchaeum sp. GoM_oil]
MNQFALLGLLGLGAYAVLSGGSTSTDNKGSGALTPTATRRVGNIVNPQQPTTINYNFPQEPGLLTINLAAPDQVFGGEGKFDATAWDNRSKKESNTTTQSSSGGSNGIYKGTRGPIDFTAARSTTGKKSSSALPSYMNKDSGIPAHTHINGGSDEITSDLNTSVHATPYTHESTHVSGGADDIDSDLNMSAIPDWFFTNLTVTEFQATPATGTCDSSPEHVNDNNTNTPAGYSAVDQYAEISLPVAKFVNRVRFDNRETHQVGDGSVKLEGYTKSGWVDLHTNEATVAGSLGTFTDWRTFTSTLVTKLRVTCTAVDTGNARTWINEVEVKGV